jgi:hypothetical protein
MTYHFHISGQSLEVLGGINLNQFHESEVDRIPSGFTSDVGFTGGLGYDFAIDSFRLRLTILYESYGGEVKAWYGGNGGGSFIETDVTKSVISLGFFPLNLKFKERLSFNVGFELSVLINEDFPGTYNRWTLGQPVITTDLEEEYSKFSNNLQYGVRLRLAYDIPIASSITISPQYGFYYGLSNEFREYPKTAKSYRHYLMVGLKKNI